MSKTKKLLIGSLCKISLFLILCLMASIPLKAKALSYRSYDYTFEETVSDTLEPDYRNVYMIECRNESYVSITVKSFNSEISNIEFCSPVSKVLSANDFKCTYDKKNKCYTYTGGLKFDGMGGIELTNTTDKPISCTVYMTSEPVINLAKTSITEITNTKHLTMTVKYKPVKKRLGYQIEYATNSKFNNKTRVNTGAATKDIGKLTKGKIYYVRVRSYARYSDGKLVYSKWSPTQKIKIKK